MKKVNLAIVGATGLVGSTVIKVLEEFNFPVENFYAFASKRSAGSTISFMGNEYTVLELNESSFYEHNIDIAIFSAGGETSRIYAPIAAKNGTIVVDNSSYWRMEKDVPLVVPEVNKEDIPLNNGIIANPNCSTIQAVVALKPLHDKYKIKRIVYSTYQSVSGAGGAGVKELEDSLCGKPNKKFPHPIAGNCIPHIDVFTENGYTKEELKMVFETQKILHDDSIKVTATTVRVPVLNSHSESINVEFYKPFDLQDLVDTLKQAPSVIVEDDPVNNLYPLAKTASGKDSVFVGRIRRDFSVDSGINLWVVADNIRKGAATNAVQIALEVAKAL